MLVAHQFAGACRGLKPALRGRAPEAGSLLLVTVVRILESQPPVEAGPKTSSLRPALGASVDTPVKEMACHFVAIERVLIDFCKA